MVLLTEWPGPASENAPVSPGGEGAGTPSPALLRASVSRQGRGGGVTGYPLPPGPTTVRLTGRDPPPLRACCGPSRW